jgi:hypothetical protein
MTTQKEERRKDMKRIPTYMIYGMLTGLLALPACTGEADDATPSATGRAVIGGLSHALNGTVTLTTRATEQADEATSSEDFTGFTAVLKREVETDVEVDIVRYEDADIALRLQGQSLELTPGNYRLLLYSDNYPAYRPDTLGTAPAYYGEVDFTIQADETTAVSALVSRPVNVGVNATFSGAVAANFTGSVTFTDATLGLQHTIACSATASEWTYFPGTPALSYRLELENEDGETYVKEVELPAGKNFLLNVGMEE